MSSEPENRQNHKTQACVPCAKRKVRCDREVPCSNCKRRKGDVCVYPAAQSPERQTHTIDLADYVPRKRVKRLEEYILALGGDPSRADGGSAAPCDADQGHEHAHYKRSIHLQDALESSLKASNIQSQRLSNIESDKKPSLILNNKKSIYIESPMWYSWVDTKEVDLSRDAEESFERPDSKATGAAGGDALLGQIHLHANDPVYQQHPSSWNIMQLWQSYLRNVHPLTMMFFSWNKEPLIEKLTSTPEQASKEEHAFMYAMYFLTIISLDEDECTKILGGKRAFWLDHFQGITEKTLLGAGFAASYDRLVLQAFMMYLHAMRNRAQPNTLYSLMGVATRIAERIGLHRDGALLDLHPVDAEERRRIWWALQYLEVPIALLAGCISLSTTSDWDTRMPANLNDSDITPDSEELPAERAGLTSMSACLCKYTFIHLQRSFSRAGSGAWLHSQLSAEEKSDKIGQVESVLRTKFLQYCEPLDPLHIYIQLSTQSVFLAFRRVLDQPRIKNAKLTDMTKEERDRFLSNCMKCLEYSVLFLTTESIRHFTWQAETYFQWTAFVYVVIEANHRYKDPKAQEIWGLISRVYQAKPEFARDTYKPMLVSFGKLVLAAWSPYYEHWQQYNATQPGQVPEMETPWFISELRQRLAQPGVQRNEQASDGQDAGAAAEAKQNAAPVQLSDLTYDPGFTLGLEDEFWDLNAIDWAFWENSSRQAL